MVRTMPVEIWKSGKGRSWYWTAFGGNGSVVADSAESYTTKANAVKGAKSAARELGIWLAESEKTKPRKAPSPKKRKPRTTAPRKRVAKRST